MSTSRPTTPVAVSDTSSDAGSLSDLESGWTDLETNRSNGRHSPATISEAGDSEDARSAIDRYDAWEGLTAEHNERGGFDVGDETFCTESPSATESSHNSSFAQQEPELTVEDWVADAVGTSLLSEDETSTPHMSFHSSSPLRLSFPDPLSGSDQDLLPSHVLSLTQSQSTDGSHRVRSHSRARTESISSITAPSASATTPSDNSFSIPDEDVEDQHEKAIKELPSVKSDPPALSYALSIVLLGHPPLPHLKKDTLVTIIDLVAITLGGSPQILEGMDTARIHEISICARAHGVTAESEAMSTHRIIIEDRTSGMSPSSSFTSFRCPTLALVFIQPPLSSPSLPSLPQNTRYLPLLLPSISDEFASSLLDLSPSVLFEHSVPDIPATDNEAMKSFALRQCDEMGINGNRLDYSKEVLTVHEFSNILAHEMSSALHDVMFPPKEAIGGIISADSIFGDVPNGVTTFRKQIVFISAFLIALLFGSIVSFRGSPAATSHTGQPISPPPQGQKVWSFLHPFVNGPSNARASPSPTSIDVSAGSSKSLIPASLKSLAVSVFLPESVEMKAANAPASPRSRPEKGKTKTKPMHDTLSDAEVRPATIDAPTPHLTIDAPYSKSLSVLPQAQLTSRVKGKGRESAVDIVPAAHTPFPSSTSTCLSARISNALTPLFDRVQTDIREILEAIDALLQALLHLQRETAYGIGEFMHALSEHFPAGQGVQKLAGKVHSVARKVSENASKRHARARYNARKVRDVSERYVIAARQQLKRSVERARGNAKTLTERIISRRSQRKAAREHRRAARINRAQGRAGCGRKGSCSEYVFESVMAFIA